MFKLEIHTFSMIEIAKTHTFSMIDHLFNTDYHNVDSFAVLRHLR